MKENKLLGNPIFDQNDTLAMKIEQKIKDGYLKTGSVGFFPSKVEIPEDEKDPCKLIYKKQELREFSICNVPANPNATVLEPDKSVSDLLVSFDIDDSVYDENGKIKEVINLPPIENNVTNLHDFYKEEEIIERLLT